MRVLGGLLTVSNSQFLNNAGTAGAVFLIYPTSGSEETRYLISDCLFEGNGSVLLLNDRGVTSFSIQSISFFKCKFTGHLASTFQVTSKLFNLDVSESSFDKETKSVKATLFGTNVTLSKVVVTRSTGPLFVLFSRVCSILQPAILHTSAQAP